MAQKYFKANIPRLENLRVGRGWSREQLAAMAIVSTRTLDSLMAGGSGTLSTFGKLAKALGEPIEQILDGYENPEPPKKRLWEITVTISTPFDQFDESRDLPVFLSHLLSKLGGDDLALRNIRPGSTELTLDVTDEQMYHVADAFLHSELANLDVERIALPSPVADHLATSLRMRNHQFGSRLTLHPNMFSMKGYKRDHLLEALRSFLNIRQG